MRVLVTGITGFTGRYQARELANAGHEVIGLAESLPSESIAGVGELVACDLNDDARLKRHVKQIRPDAVVHLAGISFVPHGDVQTIYQTNLLCVKNLLEALLDIGKPMSSVLLASSANVYGNTKASALVEATPPEPANDYAVSKIAMEYMAKLYINKLPIVMVRPFNYTGVGQSINFLVPKVVDCYKRKAAEIELGNIDIARDFSDVRNVVSVYRQLIESPHVVGKTFNVCSGQPRSLRDILEMATEITGHKIRVRVNPVFVRENEVNVLVGSTQLLDASLGGQQRIDFLDTLRWMLGAD